MAALVSYSDSGSDGEDETTKDLKSATSTCTSHKRKYESSSSQAVMKKQKLPLPMTVKNMFQKQQGVPKTDKNVDKHEGRIRSFEHVEGNWATYIYVPLQITDTFKQYFNVFTQFLKDSYNDDVHVFPLSNCHISCSRTVPARHYWIEPLFKELKDKFTNKRRFFYSLQHLKVYVNDEKTRTFIAVEVSRGFDNFEKVMRVVDDIYAGYGLEKYYKPPSFHTSIAWLLGNKKDNVERCLHNQSFEKDVHFLSAEKLCMRTGNRTYQICLI